MNKASHGRFGEEKTCRSRNCSTLGITMATESFALQLRQLLEQISFIKDQVEQLDVEIAAYMKQTDSFITTIPGIGPVLGAVILE